MDTSHYHRHEVIERGTVGVLKDLCGSSAVGTCGASYGVGVSQLPILS